MLMMEYCEKVGNFLAYSTIKVNAANVYTRLGKYPQAIRLMQQAEDVYSMDTATYANQLVGLYTNLGLVYYEMSNLDSASYYYDKAELSNQQANNPIYQAVIINNRGDIYLDRNELKKAEELYQQSLVLAIDLNYMLLVATAKLNLGSIYTLQSSYDLAETYLNEALRLYEDLNSLYFVAETNKALSHLYESKGDHAKALIFLKEFNCLEDSLKGTETLDRIASLEMELAMQMAQKKYEFIEQEKELAETKTKHQRTFLYLLIGLIALGLAVAYLLIKGLRTSLERNRLKAQHLQQRQQLLENELVFKKKEIENFSTYIMEKNNVLNEVKISLNKIKQETPESSLVRSIIQNVSHNLHVDQDRKELDLKIDQAHQEFMGRLLSKHPKLTKTEQRLCSLLLMDLSSKDISAIMNVAPDSIKKSRNRLRKKLNLEANADLTSFLKTI